MTEKQTLLAAFGGQFVTGAFTKQDGTHRPFGASEERAERP